MKFWHSTNGFTLLEVLTALSLGVGLFLLLLSIYGLSARSLAAAETQAELAQNSRLIIERLSREIRQTRQIATLLPADDSDPENPPKNEIEFQDGHGTTVIQYVRYFLDNGDIRRQARRYYFPSEPAVFVPAGSRDSFGNPPQMTVVSDELVGQYVANMQFFGRELVNINIWLNKNNARQAAKTAVYGRNL